MSYVADTNVPVLGIMIDHEPHSTNIVIYYHFSLMIKSPYNSLIPDNGCITAMYSPKTSPTICKYQ